MGVGPGAGLLWGVNVCRQQERSQLCQSVTDTNGSSGWRDREEWGRDREERGRDEALGGVLRRSRGAKQKRPTSLVLGN